jgi:hypothetical protein
MFKYGWDGRIIRRCAPHPFGAVVDVQVRYAYLSNLEVLILPSLTSGVIACGDV